MNKILKTTTFLILFMMMSFSSFAGDHDQVEMATGMYQSGKIYVVVVVMAIVFIGIAAYLVHLDRKISSLEKENRK